MKTARQIAVALLAIVATWQVIRQAFVARYGANQPQLAARLWSDHPDVAFKLELEKIALAAVAKRPVPGSSIDRILGSSALAPLAPEPFLVRGVDAQLAGREAQAGNAFLAAKRRSPASIPARYFLADHYLRTNQPGKGLVELGALTRFVPGSIESLAPYYASYARQPGGKAQLRQMLRLQPELESTILAVLAGEAGNTDLVLSIWNDSPSAKKDEFPVWGLKLIETLLADRQFAKARATWAKLGKVGPTDERSLIFNADFADTASSPPFNWTLASAASGTAEATGNGQLHVIYFGRDNATLANQTLLLAPGRYRLSFHVVRGGRDATALAWTVKCGPAGKTLGNLSLGKGSGARSIAGDFTVDTDCPAQQLSLMGSAPEFPETTDVAIGNLSLVRAGQ